MDQDLVNMFAKMSTEEQPAAPSEGNMLMVEMQKALLYPSFKKMLSELPTYLETHQGMLSDAETERYMKQIEIIQVICNLMESEQATDTDEIKMNRFNVICQEMKKLTEYGPPPEEVTIQIEMPELGAPAPPPPPPFPAQFNAPPPPPPPPPVVPVPSAQHNTSSDCPMM